LSLEENIAQLFALLCFLPFSITFVSEQCQVCENFIFAEIADASWNFFFQFDI
jgi:hypothetical protein